MIQGSSAPQDGVGYWGVSRRLLTHLCNRGKRPVDILNGSQNAGGQNFRSNWGHFISLSSPSQLSSVLTILLSSLFLPFYPPTFLSPYYILGYIFPFLFGIFGILGNGLCSNLNPSLQLNKVSPAYQPWMKLKGWKVPSALLAEASLPPGHWFCLSFYWASTPSRPRRLASPLPSALTTLAVPWLWCGARGGALALGAKHRKT